MQLAGIPLTVQILLRKGRWASDFVDVSADAMAHFGKVGDRPVVQLAPGDLFVAEATFKSAKSSANRYVLASFHGDTNGLATIGALNAVRPRTGCGSIHCSTLLREHSCAVDGHGSGWSLALRCGAHAALVRFAVLP